ncbi:hypothetical protein ACT6P6_08700 [Priestia endophytica]
MHSIVNYYYDHYILNTCLSLHKEQQNRDFLPSARVIGELLGHIPDYHSDYYE